MKFERHRSVRIPKKLRLRKTFCDRRGVEGINQVNVVNWFCRCARSLIEMLVLGFVRSRRVAYRLSFGFLRLVPPGATTDTQTT